MVPARGAHKVERVTVTLVPASDDRAIPVVPSTFSAAERLYRWRHSEQMEYLIVPKRISNTEIQVDMFVNASRKGKTPLKQVQKIVQEFVREKIGTDWKGLKLATVGRPTAATPPRKMFVRGTIEEILGANLEG